jgi:glycosyltransferase involved in cell wall biosynthesis
MRILFVSQELPPGTGWGGIGTYVDVLTRALASRGAEVHVLSVVDGQTPGRTDSAGVTIHRYSVPQVERPSQYAPESWRRVWLAFCVARLVPRLAVNPDVVECPEWMAEGLGLALRGTHPLVVRLHSTARQIFRFSGQGGSLRGLDGALAKRLEETSARRANVVISTRANLDEVAGWMRLDHDALHAIPYPVELPQVTPIRSDGPPRVTFVGRLEPRKGPEIVMRAAPKVLAAVPDARFTFVGRDTVAPDTMPSSAWLQREAQRLGVAHAIELTGELGRDGVDSQLRRATVCAFPSRWESFGNVVAEASAVGRPVVVSKIPAFRDVVNDGVTGRMVSLEDTDGWAAALISLLRDREEASALGAAGAKHIASISDPAKVAELTLAAHEHAIKRWARSQHAGQRLTPSRARRRA